MQNPISNPQNYLDDIFKKLHDIIKVCEQGNRPTSTQMTNLASQIRMFMMDGLKDSSLGTVKIIAGQLCQKYTKTFTTEISEGNIISSENYLRQKIYSTLNYYKTKDLKSKKKRMLDIFQSVDSDILPQYKVQKYRYSERFD